MMIFVLGAGISIYEGAIHILDPAPITRPWITFIVLGLAFVFESISLWYAWRAFRKTKGNHSIWQAVRRGKDPTSFMVFLEDSAALIGIVIAMAGTAILVVTEKPYVGWCGVGRDRRSSRWCCGRACAGKQRVTRGRDRRPRGCSSTPDDSWIASSSSTYCRSDHGSAGGRLGVRGLHPGISRRDDNLRFRASDRCNRQRSSQKAPRDDAHLRPTRTANAADRCPVSLKRVHLRVRRSQRYAPFQGFFPLLSFKSKRVLRSKA